MAAYDPLRPAPLLIPNGLSGPVSLPRLADHSADWRMLALSLMALVIGTDGAGAAWLLLKLIALATHLAW
ncbi:hypothetical protein NS365_04290 [Aureimonas ureilytica]|uniref:Uncharacterized protein n=1 Tax=Aureimonas ureilytica TaxID=401562 RepID=A0A175RV27_9HYPH|nr:hypothetical protein NS365_04290 [Aureimonas ureilytica]